MELWTMTVPATDGIGDRVRRYEAAGWDGVTFTDSQNLCPDPFVVMGIAADATESIGIATGVTNLCTRHPAALATAAATVQELSGGRFVLGAGRGDTALFHLGRKPMPVAQFTARAEALQAYLAGDTIELSGRPSTLRWLTRASAPKVPLDLAVSGPKMITLAGRLAERVTFALGADPDRIAWGVTLARDAAVAAGRDPDELNLGAYVNVGCHPDLDVARSMVQGAVAAFAHFSAMPGSTGAGLADDDKAIVARVGEHYDSNQHLRNDAAHTAVLDADFTDRFAIIGPPDRIVERLQELHELGIGRCVVTGPGFGSPPEHARLATQLTVGEVLPAAHQFISRRPEHTHS